jgi:hypothetical protein
VFFLQSLQGDKSLGGQEQGSGASSFSSKQFAHTSMFLFMVYIHISNHCFVPQKIVCFLIIKHQDDYHQKYDSISTSGYISIIISQG